MKKRTMMGIGILMIACLAALWILGKRVATEGFQATSTGPTFTTAPSLASLTTNQTILTNCSVVSFNIGQGTNRRGTSTAGGLTYVCKDDKSARMLLRGNDADKTKPAIPFIGPHDQVCVAQDDETPPKLYACQDRSASPDEGDYTDVLTDNYNTTCSQYTKSYFDLSNNLTSLVQLRDMAQFENSTISDGNAMLTTMYSTYSCSNPTTPANTIICNAIRDTGNAFGNNKVTVVGVLNAIIKPIQDALTSRFTVAKNVSEYRCDTDIPCDVLNTCRRLSTPIEIQLSGQSEYKKAASEILWIRSGGYEIKPKASKEGSSTIYTLNIYTCAKGIAEITTSDTSLINLYNKIQTACRGV